MKVPGKSLFNSNISAASVIWWVAGMFFVKFLIFDLIWALDTTFSGFQFPQGWLTKIALSGLLALPLLWLRSKWYVLLMGLAVDAWLVANLMYFRTYYTVIPSSSYLLVGNLHDFQSSVWDSLRLVDLLFPLSTALCVARLWRVDLCKSFSQAGRRLKLYLGGAILLPLAIVVLWVNIKGGYKEAYEDLMYDYSTCGAAVYSIPGVMIYEAVAKQDELTPEIQQKIEEWIAAKPDAGELPFIVEQRDNCIIILCESLESWALEKSVEGNEITPCINRFLREPGVLYAPNVLNQVGGARSIDAQLILHTGLLPVSYGAYSSRFPHHTYYSIDKAFKEHFPGNSRTMSFTVDKKTVWNAAIVAFDFGYDRLVDKPNFTLDVKTGPRARLGDDSFLRQSYEKIASHDTTLWIPEGHNLLQLVTYSGHTPFVIPDELKKIHFSDNIPQRLRNYMEVANYTDSAIGAFVEKIRKNPKFANTMIVITGDHEGVGIDRNSFVKNPEIAQWLNDKQMVPLIVLNSPVEMRYDGVLGQVDIYPTLLDLLNLSDYKWKGLGTSILRPGKQPFAISWQKEVIGDASGASPEQISHAKDAYSIADLIISCDYFKSH